MTEDRWKRRIDLTFHWVRGIGRSGGYWVVKDPLSRHWHSMTTREKQILDLADGTRSLRELCIAAMDLVQPMKSNVDAIAAFFLQARQRGLLVADGTAGPIESRIRARNGREKRTRSFRDLPSKVLFFRLPGFHPNRVQAIRADARLRHLAGTAVMPAAVVFVVAIAIWIANWNTFWIELSLASSRQSFGWWLTLVAAIAIAKTIHELAHVVACRVVGAECREVGVMLLLGIPCLYCDVSDLWTVSSRRDRVLVSAAGMMAETFIAAIATLIWAFTAPSMLHDVALMLMVVCSISTIVINANPLLRYDGYFILSDALGVPNLFGQAMSWLTAQVRRLIGGNDHVKPLDHHVGWQIPVAWLAFYAIASVVYRAFLLTAISILVIRFTTEIGLGWLGCGFAILFVGSIVFRVGSVLTEPASTEVSDSAIRPLAWKNPRKVIGMAAPLAAIIAVLFVPLPRSIRVPVMIVGGDEVSIFAAESGVVRVRPTGPQTVRKGDALFRLAKFELEDQWLSAAADLAEAKSIQNGWEKRRGGAEHAAAAITLANQQVDLAKEELDQVTDRRNRLVIRSPIDGWFIEGEPTSEKPPAPPGTTDQLLQLTSNKIAIGSYVRKGTVLGTVCHPTRRDGIAVLGAAEVDEIKSGQRVTLLHPTISAGETVGTIRNVANSASEPIPGLTENDPGNWERDATRFAIRIRWDPSSQIPLAIGSKGVAQIKCEPKSLAFRLRRLLSTELRW